ncbi:MAG: hypothetical protein PG981_001342 [Wolbachia endosymbiont of Ctenocephalides orientis wCori]|nr:MAG: hypothetical protein PG981_001342 [Wolbachia endosymbiont of Ctenocephalides orientis wCori]
MIEAVRLMGYLVFIFILTIGVYYFITKCLSYFNEFEFIGYAYNKSIST